MAASLAERTLKGVRWSYVSAIVVSGLQVMIGAILARLLSPSEFGLVAMAFVAIRFGQYFARLGIESAIVQKYELHPREVQAGFWTSATLGVLFAAMFAAAAPAVGSAFRSTRVIPVLQALALTFVFNGLASTALGLLRRALRFRAIASVEIASYFFGYGVTATLLALAGAGVWSLVLGNLAQSAMAAGGYFLAHPHTLKPTLRREDYSHLVSFGSKVSLVGFLEFLSTNVDTMVVGRYLGDAALGLYNRAYSLAYLPIYQVMYSMTRVLQPAVSTMQREIERIRRTYLDSVLLLSAAVLPLGWGMAAASNEIVGVLLGPRWVDAAPLAAVMAAAAPLSAVTRLGEIIAEALGHLREKLIIRATQLIFFAVLAMVAVRFGRLYVAIAFALAESLSFVAYLMLTSRLADLGITSVWKRLAPGVGAGTMVAGFALLAHWAGRAMHLPLGLTLVCQILGCAVVGIFGLSIVGNGQVWHTLARVTRGAGLPEHGLVRKGIDCILRLQDAVYTSAK